MNLNYDCIRDVLLTIADKQQYISTGGNTMRLPSLSAQQLLKEDRIAGTYSLDDFWYSMKQLYDMHYIVASPIDGGHHGVLDYWIDDITPEGHEFLKSVLEPTIWNAAKKKAATVGGGTLKLLGTIAGELCATAIQHPEEFQTILQNLH